MRAVNNQSSVKSAPDGFDGDERKIWYSTFQDVVKQERNQPVLDFAVSKVGFSHGQIWSSKLPNKHEGFPPNLESVLMMG